MILVKFYETTCVKTTLKMCDANFGTVSKLSAHTCSNRMMIMFVSKIKSVYFY